MLRGVRIVDLGTGAGLPGIPLAVACPERSFTLIDRSERRIRFVRQAVVELGLTNVVPIAIDFGDFRADTLFDTVVSRAVAKPAALWRAAAGLLSARWTRPLSGRRTGVAARRCRSRSRIGFSAHPRAQQNALCAAHESPRDSTRRDCKRDDADHCRREPEGRCRQDHHQRQSGSVTRAVGKPRAVGRSRSAGQCDDGVRRRKRGARTQCVRSA